MPGLNLTSRECTCKRVDNPAMLLPKKKNKKKNLDSHSSKQLSYIEIHNMLSCTYKFIN